MVMVLLRSQSLLLFVVFILALTGIIELQSHHVAAAENEECQDDVQKQNHDARRRNQYDSVDTFYAWSTTAPSTEALPLTNALFPNLTQFQYAWENYPLLSRVSFDTKQQQHNIETVHTKSRQIPTILHNRELITQLKLDTLIPKHNNNINNNNDPLLSLLSVDETAHILSSQPMTHGSNYQLVKKILLPSDHPTEPNEEYNGMLPKTQYTMDEIIQHFHYGGFSLIINKVQQRWLSIANFAHALEEELGVVQVGVNLYMTPEVVKIEDGVDEHDVKNQGFESHWDMMDVIVVQLSGRKRWSVASEPSIYLSSKDQKRKPTGVELEQTNRYSDFTLCPGDVLYIPRGHIHNASTVLFENLSESTRNDNDSGGEINLDNCPSYPINDVLANRLAGPSLHLTFGLLVSNESTVETLLHYALDAFFAASVGMNGKTAITSKTCSDSSQLATNYDIEWSSIFHHIIAEVARRKHSCDNILSTKGNSRNEKKEEKSCNGTAILRQSVPLMLLSNNNMRETTNNNMRETTRDDEEKNNQQYNHLKQTYTLALDVFTSSASIPNTIDFIKSHLFKPPAEESLIFHYPSYTQKDVILCPDAMGTLVEDDSYFSILKEYDEFARNHFHEASTQLNLWGQKRRESDRLEQQLNIEKLG